MKNKDWSEIGKEISESVKGAVENQDYSKLSSQIQQIVADTTGAVGQTMQNVSASLSKKNKINRQFMPKKKQELQAYNQKKITSLKRESKSNRSGGMSMIAIGIFFALFIAFTSLMDGLSDLIDSLPAVFIFAAIAVYGSVMYRKGNRGKERMERFQLYLSVLGDRDACTVKELATITGRSVEFTMNDLREMIVDNMFTHGHLIVEKKMFCTTDEAYNRLNLPPTPVKEEPIDVEYDEVSGDLPASVSQVIREGNRYIDKIHQYNNEISNMDVSNKLYRLENIVSKIFEHVKEHPEDANQVDQMIKYYLPTTVRLLESYKNLPSRSMEGDNISRSKREIEETLDTLNDAFSQLFDDLYQDTSMDISSDISVLNTLLAKDGLTGQKMKEKVK